MADVELFYFDHLSRRPEPKGASVILYGITGESGTWHRHEVSPPRTETRAAASKGNKSAAWTETKLNDKLQRASEAWTETKLEDKLQTASGLWTETKEDEEPWRVSGPRTETKTDEEPWRASGAWTETKLEDKPQTVSGPWTETKLEDKPQSDSASWAETRLENQTETFFSYRHQSEEDLHLQTCRVSHCFPSTFYEEERMEEQEEEIPELYLLSDEDLSSDGSGKSVDYGFIIAVSCLVTGISLVAISYSVPRDIQVDRDSVSAREIERLEWGKAQLGAHLEQCVIAGLCLLTLGGVLLSTLLMISMWKGEMIRKKAFAYSKQAANLYGSMSLRTSSSPALGSSSHVSEANEDLEVLS
ncbi:uncharacterized protein LOC117501444 isoform X2 [Thalassophryne amazonica]|uniref:uncharacterized protein LOC117501444 isoform X2 n=1 Tax=Thalassophryne amazonica TaxID=390379 RepID=UPI0014711970|nr:uncharacterized protein LOC117501444 isoform X2 [Thalassophryne amazonica]